ncbi:hypothetical protein ACFL1H_01540 [Nanoarchaeota archaeon]
MSDWKKFLKRYKDDKIDVFLYSVISTSDQSHFDPDELRRKAEMGIKSINEMEKEQELSPGKKDLKNQFKRMLDILNNPGGTFTLEHKVLINDEEFQDVPMNFYFLDFYQNKDQIYHPILLGNNIISENIDKHLLQQNLLIYATKKLNDLHENNIFYELTDQTDLLIPIFQEEGIYHPVYSEFTKYIELRQSVLDHINETNIIIDDDGFKIKEIGFSPTVYDGGTKEARE